MIYITENSTKSDIIDIKFIDYRKLYVVNNVRKYTLDVIENRYQKWKIERYDENENENDKNYYYIIDYMPNYAIGHWVFEGAMFLNTFHLLKKEYPNIKIVIMKIKNENILKFKLLFLKKFFIEMENIYCIDCNDDYDKNDLVYLKNNNICFFNSPMFNSGNLDPAPEIYKKHVDDFFHYFNKDTKPHNKYIDMLLLPKQNKIRQIGRFCDMSDIEKTFMEKNIGYILHTDIIENLDVQIEFIKSANIIVAGGGSPVIINSLFTKNTVFIGCDPDFYNQSRIFPRFNYIYNKYIENGNKLLFMNCHPNATRDYPSSKYTYNDLYNIMKNNNIEKFLFMEKVCKICHKTCSNKCSVCKNVYYCSAKCQQKDWKFHKQICKETFSLAASLANSTAEGLYFKIKND